MSTYRNFLVGTVQSIQSKGLAKTLKELLTLSQARVGSLVGTDAAGNEYYENRDDMHGRDRWVIYKKWDSDASQVPPEWHQWLHRMSDTKPTPQTFPQPLFAPQTHMENMTGTRGAFKTYSTVKPKIDAWAPENVQARSQRG